MSFSCILNYNYYNYRKALLIERSRRSRVIIMTTAGSNDEHWALDCYL